MKWTFPSLTCPLLQIGMSVKNRNRMANSVHPDETGHYEPSDQDLHCLHTHLVWSAGQKGLTCWHVKVDIQVQMNKKFGEKKTTFYDTFSFVSHETIISFTLLLVVSGIIILNHSLSTFLPYFYCCRFNPFTLSGLIYHNSLDWAISNRRVSGQVLLFLCFIVIIMFYRNSCI